MTSSPSIILPLQIAAFSVGNRHMLSGPLRSSSQATKCHSSRSWGRISFSSRHNYAAAAPNHNSIFRHSHCHSFSSSLSSQKQEQQTVLPGSSENKEKTTPTTWNVTEEFSTTTAIPNSHEYSVLHKNAQQQQHHHHHHPLPPTNQILGVIFDMDGTLTRPCINFTSMRERIHAIANVDLGHNNFNHNNGCVLEITSRLSPKGQHLAKQVFYEIEMDAIAKMTFMHGIQELCTFLDVHEIKRGVLTRNVEDSIHAMHAKLWEQEEIPEFHPVVARDTVDERMECVIPPKPAPDAIHYICSVWGCTPSQVIMVGDSDKDDIVAAFRAGCAGSVLLRGANDDEKNGIDHDSGTSSSIKKEGEDAEGRNGQNNNVLSEKERQERTPSVTVGSLWELMELLKQGKNLGEY